MTELLNVAVEALLTIAALVAVGLVFVGVLIAGQELADAMMNESDKDK